MPKKRIFLASVFLSCGLATPTISTLAQSTNSAQIVEDARPDYYNLRHAGLTEFRCDVKADWNAALGPTTDASAREKLLPALGQTHFAATVGVRGAPKIELKFDGAAPSNDVAQSVRTATGSAQRTLSGAIEEFSSLLFGSPLPPDRDYHVEDQGQRLRITFGSDEVRVVETMNKNHAIEEMMIATQHSTVSVRPGYQRGVTGFVPLAIDSSVEVAGADKVESHVAIAYQAVEEFQLPQSMTVRDKQLASGAPVQFSFSGCQVTK